MSTSAPARGVQAAAAVIWETPRARSSGTPGFNAPVAGSVRRSERLSRSSTKYGPSVTAGVTTQGALAEVEGDAVSVGVVDCEPLPHPLTKPTATTEPRREMTSRRLTKPSFWLWVKD